VVPDRDEASAARRAEREWEEQIAAQAASLSLEHRLAYVRKFPLAHPGKRWSYADMHHAAARQVKSTTVSADTFTSFSARA
jgi:hypothetical protein